MTRCVQCRTFVDVAVKTEDQVGWLCLPCITGNLRRQEGRSDD